jgi:APA family basic amino acid/polyamine antiporter
MVLVADAPPPAQPPALRRDLGVWAVTGVVIGDMLGSGIFFTPGELAAVATAPWQVYALWALAGGITLCGALTLAELASRIPQAGAPFHVIRETFGPFLAFATMWMQVWVAGPGSIAGVAIAFGEFVVRTGDGLERWPASAWGVAGIAFFVGINLLGVRWGGRTQIALTASKIGGLLALVVGSLFVASATVSPGAVTPTAPVSGSPLLDFIRVVGLGIGAVLFTYDGWIDVSYLSGEVKDPKRHLSRGLGFGVGAVTLLYLIVNYAFLRVVPLETMRAAPTTIAADAARAVFGPTGGAFLNAVVMLSIFGALGGLIMTLPRLYYAAAAQYARETAGRSRVASVFRTLSFVTTRTAVPAGSVLFAGIAATVALLFFGTFSRIVNFFVVPLQLNNVLMVAALFRMQRHASGAPDVFRMPGYPVLPLVYIAVIAFFLVSAIIFRPYETLAGVGLTMTAAPAYWLIFRRTP